MSSCTVVTVIERKKVEAINREHELCERSGRQALLHAMNCGRMLAAVKADLGHGQWTGWVEDHFAGSLRTAQTYMQLADADASGQVQNTQSAAHLSIAAALRQITQPRPSPSSRDAAALVAGLVDDDEDRPAPPVVAESETPWSVKHDRRRARLLAALEAVRADVERAGPDLSAHGIEGLLRGAAIRARQTAAEIEALAFEFAG